MAIGSVESRPEILELTLMAIMDKNTSCGKGLSMFWVEDLVE
jgi:hypothetical protein